MSDSASQDSSLDTADSPSIDMDSNYNHNNNNSTTNTTTTHPSHTRIKQQPLDPDIHSNNMDIVTNSSSPSFLHYDDIKPENNDNNMSTNINLMHDTTTSNNNTTTLPPTTDDTLFNPTNDIESNPMEFLMLHSLSQNTSNPHSMLQSPLLGPGFDANGNFNMTPSLAALQSGINLFDGSTPNLPPLSIDANSQTISSNINKKHNNNDHNNNISTKDSDNEDNDDIDLPQKQETLNDNDEYMLSSMGAALPPSHAATMPEMPYMSGIGDNIPPPTNGLDWTAFCKLIEQNNNNPNGPNSDHLIQQPMPQLHPYSQSPTMPPSEYDHIHVPNHHTLSRFDEYNDNQPHQPHEQQIGFLPLNSMKETSPTTTATTDDRPKKNKNNKKNNRKRKNTITVTSIESSVEIQEQSTSTSTSPTKRRKLSETKTPKKERTSSRKKQSVDIKNDDDLIPVSVPKKRKRGRPRKNPEKSQIKKEKKGTKRGKKKNDSDDEINMEEYYASQQGQESYVGIRTDDGEVRVQIPPATKSEDYPKVKFTVFGNACSDKIEDILQPKKRTRYVRGLSEEEKKTRRREQNRNAAARSRARKNAMISKVIQLHQENMGLRAFVAENITQTKILRDEINRLNQYIAMQHHHAQQYHHALLASQQHHQQSANMEATKLSSPSSTKSQTQQQSSLFEIISQDSLFQNEGQ